MNKRLGTWLTALLLIGNASCLCHLGSPTQIPELTQGPLLSPEPWEEYQPEIQWARDKDTAQDIYDNLIDLGIKHPDIVLCQVILETGHFNSYAYHHRNNLLGLGGDYGNNLRFKSKKDSMRYYKRWQDNLYSSTKRKGDYYDFLNRLTCDNRGRWLRYAADPAYTTKLKQIHKKVFGPTAMGPNFYS